MHQFLEAVSSLLRITQLEEKDFFWAHWIAFPDQSHLFKATEGRSHSSCPNVREAGDISDCALDLRDRNGTDTCEKESRYRLEYFLFKSLGLDIFFQENRVKSIFLYNEGSENHKKFPGRTPNGVHLGSSRSDVLELLGEPEKKGIGAFQDRLYMYRDGIDFTFLPDDTIHHIVLRPPTD